MKKIKETANLSSDATVKKNAIDSLVAYGNNGIAPIHDIVDSPFSDSDIQAYGLDAIRKIKDRPQS